MSQAWKDEERIVARRFGQRRRPLSGMSTAGLGLSDTMELDGKPADLFIEVKNDKSMFSSSLRQTIMDTMRKAASEGKPWIITLHQPKTVMGAFGFGKRYVVCDLDYFQELHKCSKLIKVSNINSSEHVEQQGDRSL
jgi:hypothetical protein